jgi:hypothetical protein
VSQVIVFDYFNLFGQFFERAHYAERLSTLTLNVRLSIKPLAVVICTLTE